MEAISDIVIRKVSFCAGTCSQIYSVVPGDNLDTIAKAKGMALTDLIAANPQISNPDLIFAGQVCPGTFPDLRSSESPSLAYLL